MRFFSFEHHQGSGHTETDETMIDCFVILTITEIENTEVQCCIGPFLILSHKYEKRTTVLYLGIVRTTAIYLGIITLLSSPLPCGGSQPLCLKLMLFELHCNHCNL